jgi:tRNA A37 threonylcarbamoyladenosine synthetase subunit TsaC/SUA5/YrdC
VEARQVRLITTDAEYCARALADGAAVAHPFGNIYGITSRADAETVRRVNVMKGRPPEQIGSITGPPSVISDVWNFNSLPSDLSRRTVLDLVDAFLELGPFGFRGPAAAHVPRHLTGPDGGISTAQFISPGSACPSNDSSTDAWPRRARSSST